MTVLVWITEGTWEAAVDAASAHTPSARPSRLMFVTSDEVAEAAHGAFAGLLERGRPGRDPGDRVQALTDSAAADLLAGAARRLDRDQVTRVHRHCRVEHEVVHAAEEAELLICARDGDRRKLGPLSLGHLTRFVVDHATCPVLLVWPAPAPGLDSLPPTPTAGPPPPQITPEAGRPRSPRRRTLWEGSVAQGPPFRS